MTQRPARRTPHDLTKADARFRELVYELKLLTVAFPHLKDAVDKEDLPVSFLLKRGAARAAAAKKNATKKPARRLTKRG